MVCGEAVCSVLGGCPSVWRLFACLGCARLCLGHRVCMWGGVVRVSRCVAWSGGMGRECL